MSRENMNKILEGLNSVRIDTDGNPVRIPEKTRRAINKKYGEFCKTYFKSIPLTDIFGILKSFGVEAVQEDGTPWEGFLTGRDGRATIDLALYDQESDSFKLVKGSALILTWHKMEVSGNWEIVAYIS